MALGWDTVKWDTFEVLLTEKEIYISNIRKSDEQGREPEAGAARPPQESWAAPASGSPHGKQQRFTAKRGCKRFSG